MNLDNLSVNKSSSKKRAFNNFSVVTDLVRKFKESNNQSDLLEIIKNLEGIINTYTIMCTPPDSQQNIYITPYMKKFLGMFLTAEERINTNNTTYLQAAQRVRWQLRHYTYEDMYSKLIEIIIEIVRKMRIVGDCDCIYFIQKMVQYKMYDLVMTLSKDLYSHVYDTVDFTSDDSEDNNEDECKFKHKSLINYNEHDINFELFYSNVTLECLVEEFDFYKNLNQYEKFLYYLIYGLSYSNRQIFSVLKHKSEEEILLDRNKLNNKLLAIGQNKKVKGLN
jgi:hypothetical protein